MKFMLLIYQGDAPRPRRDGESNERAVAAFENLPEDEKKAIYGAYMAINQTPGVSPGLQLQPPERATTVRVQGGKTLTTDGPFVETKEAIAGYLLFEADDLDAAIELAARIPSTSMGGAVEVRPIVEW
ncbi:MAG: YciI family protein [Actinomycetota bacterium]